MPRAFMVTTLSGFWASASCHSCRALSNCMASKYKDPRLLRMTAAAGSACSVRVYKVMSSARLGLRGTTLETESSAITAVADTRILRGHTANEEVQRSDTRMAYHGTSQQKPP